MVYGKRTKEGVRTEVLVIDGDKEKATEMGGQRLKQ